jgi:hypothetical protein
MLGGSGIASIRSAMRMIIASGTVYSVLKNLDLSFMVPFSSKVPSALMNLAFGLAGWKGRGLTALFA